MEYDIVTIRNNTQKILITLIFGMFILLLVGVSLVNASFPLDPTPRTFHQPDNSTFLAHLIGDYDHIGYVTVDGNYAITYGNDGYWHYIDATGSISSIVGNGSPQITYKTGYYNPSDTQVKQVQSNQVQPLIVYNNLDPISPALGTTHFLVILVNFSDSGPNNYTRQQYQNVLFTPNQPSDNIVPFGSVHDYYNEVSYGKMNVTGTVYDWVTLNHPASYYLPDNGQQLADDAIDMASSKYNIDWSKYDIKPADYKIDSIIFVVAGSDGYWDDTNHWHDIVKPYFDGLSSHLIPNTNYKLQNYIIDPSLGTGNTSITRIGFFAHEMGHAFGLPDMYTINPVTNQSDGANRYDLMSYGARNDYNNQGEGSSPAELSAWSKTSMGIIIPTQITQDTQGLSILPAENNQNGAYQFLDNPGGYDFCNSGSPTGQFFMVEYRRQIGFDRGLPQSGVIIWHIDEGYSNEPVDLEESTGDDSNIYAAWSSSNTNGFTLLTNPNSNFWEGNPSGVSITDISGVPSDDYNPMSIDVNLPLPGYGHIKSNGITGSIDGALSNYQVKYVVHSGSGTDNGQEVYLNGQSQSWPNDIRFTNSTGSLLNYWIESNDSNNATIWVKVDQIPVSPGSATVNIYYGKSGDAGASNGSATFVFFDDFSSLNSSVWTSGWTPVVNGGSVDLNSAGDYIQSKSTFDPGSTALRAKIYTGLPSDYFTCFGYGGYQSGGGWNYLNADGAYVWFEFGVLGDYTRWFIHNTAVNYGATPYPTNEWHTYDIRLNSSRNSISINRDNSLLLTGSSSSSVTSPRSIFFGRHTSAAGSADMKADWILVRKYTQHEPGQSMQMMVAPNWENMQTNTNITQQNNQSLNNTTIKTNNSTINSST